MNEDLVNMGFSPEGELYILYWIHRYLKKSRKEVEFHSDALVCDLLLSRFKSWKDIGATDELPCLIAWQHALEKNIPPDLQDHFDAAEPLMSIKAHSMISWPGQLKLVSSDSWHCFSLPYKKGESYTRTPSFMNLGKPQVVENERSIVTFFRPEDRFFKPKDCEYAVLALLKQAHNQQPTSSNPMVYFPEQATIAGKPLSVKTSTISPIEHITISTTHDDGGVERVEIVRIRTVCNIELYFDQICTVCHVSLFYQLVPEKSETQEEKVKPPGKIKAIREKVKIRIKEYSEKNQPPPQRTGNTPYWGQNTGELRLLPAGIGEEKNLMYWIGKQEKAAPIIIVQYK